MVSALIAFSRASGVKAEPLRQEISDAEKGALGVVLTKLAGILTPKPERAVPEWLIVTSAEGG